ncbi:MAG: hypothetical protein AT714_03920 [Vulcanisaeta sp. OSP_8]|nr:MAG: hypothetical protein AT714_03920 [Vulcanisaeta sp. OSP_8]
MPPIAQRSERPGAKAPRKAVVSRRGDMGKSHGLWKPGGPGFESRSGDHKFCFMFLVFGLVFVLLHGCEFVRLFCEVLGSLLFVLVLSWL